MAWEGRLKGNTTFLNGTKLADLNGKEGLALETREAFFSMVHFLVGSGDNISFWHDIWAGSTPLASLFRSLFHCASDVKALVRNYSSKWEAISCGVLFSEDISQKWKRFSLLWLLSLHGSVFIPDLGVDRRVWKEVTEGSFSVSFFP